MVHGSAPDHRVSHRADPPAIPDFAGHRRYESDRLEMIWHGLPLRVRLMSHFNARLYPVIRAVRLAGRILGTASGARETDLFRPPAPINGLLETIFAGETRTLVELLEGRREAGYRKGVSLSRSWSRYQPVEPVADREERVACHAGNYRGVSRRIPYSPHLRSTSATTSGSISIGSG